MTEQDAKNELLSPRMGAEIEVVAGKKIPLGSRGIVRWAGQGSYGPIIGIAFPADPHLQYTSPNNVEGVFPGLSPGETPEGGWIKLWEEVRGSIRPPKKGDCVRALTQDGPVIGTVFWTSDTRVGVRVSSDTEGIFADLERLESLTPEGAWKPCVTPVRAVPAGKAPAPVGFKDLSVDDDDAQGGSSCQNPSLRETSWETSWETYRLDKPLDLPAPFSEITQFTRKVGEKFFSARDKNGEEICTLPEDTVWGLLPEPTHLNESPF